MEVIIENKIPKAIDRKSILQQTAFWSEVKKRLGIDSKAFEIKARAADIYASSTENQFEVDDMLVLLQPIGNEHSIGYVPYGPTLKPSEENQGPFLEELSETLRPNLPASCVALRYDLLWESPWARDDDYFNDRGEWLGPPARRNQEFRLNFDTQNWNLKKANTNILPSDTVFIDLKKDENQLLSEMKPKTRYNIRLSLRKGVRINRIEPDRLDAWYGLYKDTCLRNGVFLHDIAYFKTVLETKATDSSSPAEIQLLLASNGKQPLAAMMLAISGNRATYLYGASSSTNRNYMGSYALQWDAIIRAKKRGCTEYDLFGISPRPNPAHPLYGLYRFKTGFGGRQFHRMGCWDYPLNQEAYPLYLSAEMTGQGYHTN
jgi:hypothetical protein